MAYASEPELNVGRIIRLALLGAFILAMLVTLGMWGCPKYNVYSERLSGQAELEKAEFNRRIQIEEARAKLEAAKHLGDAEIERARGVAEANKIIGESLKNNEGYLRYLWILGLQQGQSETIYIPTEAGLPILEASRSIRPAQTPEK